MTNPYAPDETPSQILSENTWLQGALLSNTFYGIELTLSAICFKLLVRRINRQNYRCSCCLLAFVTVIFLLGTIFMAGNSEFTQLSFIEDRNFPGGPGAFEVAMFAIPAGEVGMAAMVVGNWLMDLLLVWRCMVIYTGFRSVSTWIVMLLPCLLFLASVALGILFLLETANSSPFGPVSFSIAYFSTTLALNIIVTIFIVARLLTCRWRFARTLGAEHVSYYSNLAAILVESASLYSVFLLPFVVTLVLEHPIAQILVQTVGQVQTVSSLLIIFRVATGRGWAEGASTQIMPNPGPDEVRLKKLSSMHFDTSKATSSMVGVTVTQEVFTDHRDESSAA